MKRVYMMAVILWIGVCGYFAVSMELTLYHLALLLCLIFAEIASESERKRIPVAWWQIPFFDEKRDWSFSYTRSVTSLLLGLCAVAVIRAIERWQITTDMVSLLGVVFALVAALLGIKRGTEALKGPSGTLDEMNNNEEKYYG